MNILQAAIDVFTQKKRRYEIVERLLKQNHITTKEAATLLQERNSIVIQKLEMTTGAKIVTGDDSSIEYR